MIKNVTGFAKTGLPQTSNLLTSKDRAINLNFVGNEHQLRLMDEENFRLVCLLSTKL